MINSQVGLKVLTMQRNWIGKSTGLTCDFELEGGDDKISIFTTRPDTIFGVTFMSLAPEHPLIDNLISGTEAEPEIRRFIKEIIEEKQRQTLEDDPEKKGIFTGKYCINPFNGNKVPVYIANFVLIEYGTGAVMAVPAHDQRDFDFAKKYNLPITPVVIPEDVELSAENMSEASTEPGKLINSGDFSGMDSLESQKVIISHAQKNEFGTNLITYRLRDWGISRQRYWGAPIPMIHCESCGVVPVPDSELPVTLPEDASTATSCAPLHQREEFINTTCPKCNGPAKRETDTMDTFMESSWYFARYTTPRCEDAPLEKRVLHIGYLSINILEESNMPFSTCSTLVFSQKFYAIWATLM